MNAPDLQLQTDTAARLQTVAFFVDLAIALEADGQTSADVQRALGPMYAGGNAAAQRGTLILVMQTSDAVDEKTPNVPGPQEVFDLTIRVLQLPKVAALQPNSKHYTLISKRIKQSLHLWQIGTCPVTYLGSEPYNDGEGTVGKDIRFTWKPAAERLKMCVNPTIQVSPDGGIVLACNQAGAVIRATFDGSFPANVDANATPTATKALPGQVVRAVAYAADLLPSGITESQYLPA